MTARVSAFVHRFEPPPSPAAPVLLMLHGTGGNEDDLLPLARMLAPGSGVLSPRGKVLERGMPRFFRRLAEGVFDTEDVSGAPASWRSSSAMPPRSTDSTRGA